jgi:hypothetical protein
LTGPTGPRIAEQIIINDNPTSNTFTVNYLDGAIYYLSGISNSSTISLKIQNLPSLTNIKQSYIISTIMKGNTSANTYIANVNVSVNTSLGNYITPKYSSTQSDVISIVTSITPTGYILQQICYIYIDNTPTIFSNISTFTTFT